VKEHIQRYKQTIRYTDEFIRELDVQMKNTLGCENYLLCIVGDHAEAFGEHGLYGHERLAFEEVLRVPWVMKGRFIDKGRKVNRNTASIDIAPTLLSAAGCELDDQSQSMDGVNTLAYKGNKRKLYFSGWLQESPTGFVLGDKKYFHNPQTQKSVMYNLKKDPQERNRKILNEKKAETLKKDLFEFRRNSLFKIEHPKTSEIILYDRWRCKSYQRLCEAEYIPEEKTQE
jgi:arylsulfatase A-like enzyme